MAKIVSVDIHHNATINKESMKVVSKCWPLVLQEIHTKTDQEAQLLQRNCTSTPCQWKYSRLLRNGRKMPLRKLQISKKLSRSLVLVPIVPSVLWRCWLGGRKGNRPVKNWVVGCWRGYLSGAICRLHMAQLMPLPLTVSCFSKIQIGFAFLVPAHLGSPRQRAVNGCVCSIGANRQDIQFPISLPG